MKNSGIIRSLLITAALFMAGFAIGQPPRGPFVVAYLCSYAPFTQTEEFQKNFGANYSPNAGLINKQLKLFTISVGTEDFLHESVKQNIAMYKGKGLKVKSYIVSGGHTWMNCKQYLGTTLQEIFK